MHPARLLILDDDLTVGQILMLAARASGCESRLCTEVPDFLAALQPWAPTHLAIDLTLPGCSGLEVLRAVAGAGCSARVIVCSGAGRSELDAALDEARALALPTAGALPKPFTLAQLRALLAAAG